MDSGKMGYVCKRKRGKIVERLLMEGGKIEGMSPKGRRKACGCLQAEKGERLCDGREKDYQMSAKGRGKKLLDVCK